MQVFGAKKHSGNDFYAKQDSPEKVTRLPYKGYRIALQRLQTAQESRNSAQQAGRDLHI